MLEAAAILARLDVIMRELAELRAELAAALRAPVAEGNGLDADSDFAPECLIEISTAVGRFNRPADSLRWMCRKIAGGWMGGDKQRHRIGYSV